MKKSNFAKLDDQPLVSILLPVFNGEPFLEKAVLSIVNQTYHNWELLIIDDNSWDRSADISIEFARIFPNIKLIKNDGIGLPAALNCGAKAAKGQLIARMDSDDICLKKRLSEQVKRFRLNDRLAILGSSAVIVESDGKISGHHLAFPSPLVELLMLYECSLIHPSVMMRREVFEFVGAYNVEYKSAQDYELWLRALFDGLRFDNVTQPLIVLRKRKSSNSRNDPTAHDLRVRCLSEKVKQRLGAGFLLVRCVGFICRVLRLFYLKVPLRSSAMEEAKRLVGT